MPDLTEDINVDELRRRARRRLVGAVVLALAAAVIVPMLLESEPRPLGEDVAVRIPPVDDGKFVNRLNDPARSDKPANRTGEAKDSAAKATRDANGAEAAKATDAARPKYDTRLADKDAPPSDKAPSPSDKTAPASDGKTTAASDAKPGAAGNSTAAPANSGQGAADAGRGAKDGAASTSPAPAPTGGPATTSSPSAPPSQPVVTAKAAPSTSPSSAAPAPAAKVAAAAASPPPSANGAFAVQLAAFSDDKGANALAGRLKRAGYTAYTEPYKTSKGTLWRVRVGPYPSHEAATAARDKLKAEGQNGIVAPAHS